MNSWIQHVKQVQRENGISYKDALKLASQSYGGSIASEKVRRFIYKKGFDPAKLKNPSKFISDGKYKKTKKPKKNYKTYEELREHELQDLLEQDKTDKEYERLYRENKKLGGSIFRGAIPYTNQNLDKFYIKGHPTPSHLMGGGAFLNPLMGKVNLKKGGKIKGKGFWDNVLKTVDYAGHRAGNMVSTALGKELGIPVPNSYDLGRSSGEQIGTALRKQIKGY